MILIERAVVSTMDAARRLFLDGSVRRRPLIA